VKRSKFTEDQIAFALKQNELGTSVDEVCRKMGISDATFYVWKKKYSGIGPSELRRLRQLEEESRKLKQIVADLSLDKAMCRRSSQKNLRPSHRRELVPELMQRFGCSQRNALRVVRMSASSYLYRSVARDASALKMRIKEITQTRVHYGYRRVHVMQATRTTSSACTGSIGRKACRCV
jgi:transposase-like protein